MMMNEYHAILWFYLAEERMHWEDENDVCFGFDSSRHIYFLFLRCLTDGNGNNKQ